MWLHRALEFTIWRMWRIRSYALYGVFCRKWGNGSVIRAPLLVSGVEYVSLGKRVMIRDGVRIEVIDLGRGNIPELIVGDDVNIEQNVHITCNNLIKIGNKTSITANCAIVDITHPLPSYDGTSKPGDEISKDSDSVTIGERCIIGYGSVILPGTHLGDGCFVGAGSVVKGTFSSYSVLAGAPAKVVRKWDKSVSDWVRQMPVSKDDLS